MTNAERMLVLLLVKALLDLLRSGSVAQSMVDKLEGLARDVEFTDTD